MVGIEYPKSETLNECPVVLQIRVYCRVKPHAMSSVRCMPDQCGLQISVDGKDHALEFDKVYGPASTQEQVRLRGYWN